LVRGQSCCSLAPSGGLHASRPAAKQEVFCVYKPKAPFKPVFEVATTREDSEVALVHDPEAKPQIADQPPAHVHGVGADSCSWWRRGRVEVAPSILEMGLYPVAPAMTYL